MPRKRRRGGADPLAPRVAADTALATDIVEAILDGPPNRTWQFRRVHIARDGRRSSRAFPPAAMPEALQASHMLVGSASTFVERFIIVVAIRVVSRGHRPIAPSRMPAPQRRRGGAPDLRRRRAIDHADNGDPSCAEREDARPRRQCPRLALLGAGQCHRSRELPQATSGDVSAASHDRRRRGGIAVAPHHHLVGRQGSGEARSSFNGSGSQ